MLVWWGAAFALLLGLSAYCSMTEAAFLAVNKVRLRHLMQRGSPAAKRVYKLLTQLDRLIGTILVTNNLINVGISVLGTVLLVRLLGPEEGPLAAAVAVTIVLLVFGEITPKLFATRHADRVALALGRPTTWLLTLMRPAVALFTGTSHFIMRVLGEHRLTRSPLITEE
ncbi:MAG: DUF21 domain-containing protein, partial [Candidatus Omnitrophica bacterium]|nr:DUF21 domain-containing protein [Candidatus Omnitrophota bacterium]